MMFFSPCSALLRARALFPDADNSSSDSEERESVLLVDTSNRNRTTVTIFSRNIELLTALSSCLRVFPMISLPMDRLFQVTCPQEFLKKRNKTEKWVLFTVLSFLL